MTVNEQAERTILKKYRKQIWNQFIGAIRDYQLISEQDRIGVCISGGKDSMLLAKSLQLLQRHSEFPFSLEYLVMDPGYTPKNRQKILKNAEALDLPVKIFETDIFRVVANTDRSPCYLCARMRRGYLYKMAQEAGCNKIALGHHFDDVIETVLMSMLYGGEIRTMMPKLKSQNFPGMELIRPLYLVREDAVLNWRRRTGLEFLECACSVTQRNAATGDGSKRQEMKRLIRQFRQTSPYIDINIMKSIHNVNLETVVGFRKDGEHHSFLEWY